MKYNPPSHDKMGTHMKYFKETFKYRRSAIKCMELTTITNIIEEFPRFKDVSDLVKFYVLSEIKGGACCGHMYICII